MGVISILTVPLQIHLPRFEAYKEVGSPEPWGPAPKRETWKKYLAPHCTLAQLWLWTKWKSFFLSPLCKTAFPDLLCFSYLWPFVQWNQQNQWWYFCFFPNSWCAFPIIEFYYKIFGISGFISIFFLLALQYSLCADTHGKHPVSKLSTPYSET